MGRFDVLDPLSENMENFMQELRYHLNTLVQEVLHYLTTLTSTMMEVQEQYCPLDFPVIRAGIVLATKVITAFV